MSLWIVVSINMDLNRRAGSFRWVLFLGSAALHLLLVFGLGQMSPHPRRSDQDLTEFEVVTRPIRRAVKSDSRSRGVHQSQAVNGRSKLESSISDLAGIRAFVPDWDPSESQVGSLRGKKAYRGQSDREWFSENSKVDRLGAEWGEGAETFERVQDYRFMRHLYDQVDGHLFYPGVFARHQVSGTINARLVFDKEGHCDFHKTRIFGTEKNLQVFVLDVLKKTCRQTYLNLLGGRELTIADLSFQFEITEHDDETLKAKKKFVIGNALAFYRNAHQSRAEWHLGPFKGMFPLPMINLDFIWIQEHWEQLMGATDAIH